MIVGHGSENILIHLISRIPHGLEEKHTMHCCKPRFSIRCTPDQAS
jgi:hypothetical protein